MSEEDVTLKVKYELPKIKSAPVYSKIYEVKINLAPEEFDGNKMLIVNACKDFKTKEERVYYHMFDPDTQMFITKCDELRTFVKNKKPIVMKSCTAFSKEIIEILREEETRYRLGKNIDVKDAAGNDQIARVDTLSAVDEKYKTRILKTIFNLKKNYFDIDMFSEEFISYEGIKYLISFLQLTSGNLRAYAVEALSKLLIYQSSSDYIQKKKENIDALYEILIKSDTINCSLFTLNTLIAIISQDEEKAMYLIDVAEKYAKKSVTPVFSQVISFLSSSKDTNLKSQTLLFINVLLNFCDSFRLPKLIIEFKEAGIYEALEKVSKFKENNFQEQLTNFQMKTGKIISGSDYELEVYKKQLEEMKEKCKEAEEKYEQTVEAYYMYEKIVQEIITINGSHNRNIFFDPKEPTERVEHKQQSPIIKYDKNGIFDFLDIYQDSKNLETVKKYNEYCQLKNEFNRIVEENTVLESKQKELIEAKVKNIEDEIKNISYKKDEHKKENE